VAQVSARHSEHTYRISALRLAQPVEQAQHGQFVVVEIVFGAGAPNTQVTQVMRAVLRVSSAMFEALTFPKSTNFKRVTQEQFDDALYKVKHRPRKCLGYKTPTRYSSDSKSGL
jgi:hypothetical protein